MEPNRATNAFKHQSKNQWIFPLKKVPSFIEKWFPDGSPKGSQNAYFGGPLGCLFQDLSRGPKMEPTWLQNGAKMGPNGGNLNVKWS